MFNVANSKRKSMGSNPPFSCDGVCDVPSASASLEYVVDGFTLGSPGVSRNPTYADYRCAPTSDTFPASTLNIARAEPRQAGSQR